MNRTFKAAVAAFIFAVGFAGSASAGSVWEDAAAAFDDYATVLRLMRPLERLQGDPSTFVVIIAIAAVAFLAGRFSKLSTRRTSSGFRAELARQAWWKRRWRRDQARTSEGVVLYINRPYYFPAAAALTPLIRKNGAEGHDSMAASD